MSHCATCDQPYRSSPSHPNQRFCSRRCQLAARRRTASRIVVDLSPGDFAALVELADECETTIQELAVDMIRVGIARCAA